MLVDLNRCINANRLIACNRGKGVSAFYLGGWGVRAGFLSSELSR